MKQNFQNQKSSKKDFSNEKSSNRQSGIKKSIETIYNGICATTPETMTVCLERPAKGTTCAGIISVYSKADLVRQNKETAAFNVAVRCGADRASLQKPFRALPHIRYAFYPSVYSTEKIGSVAIYGPQGLTLFPLLKKRMALFGRRISSIELEKGLSLFLSVKFAPGSFDKLK